MRDSPRTVAEVFTETSIATPTISLKGLSCPTRSNVMIVHFPKLDLPYDFYSKPKEELIVSYSIEDSNVGGTPLNIFNRLYSRYGHGKLRNENVLNRIRIGESEYLFGNGIILENGFPLIVFVRLRDGSQVKKRVMITTHLLSSFNPVHKYILQKIVFFAANSTGEVRVMSDFVSWIPSHFALSGSTEKQYNEGEILLEHLDEIYENCR